MENTSELLIRSAMHDLANVLAGIRGILDLTRPDQPLVPRDRERLDAVLQEGMATVERTRNLAMEQFPCLSQESGPDWRGQLQEQLVPMGIIFRCRFELACETEPALDRWPGDLLRGYVRAVTRQVLPYIQDGRLDIQFSADAQEWRVRWAQAGLLPEGLTAAPEVRHRDISCRWASQVGQRLGASLTLEDGALLARVPRP